MNLYDGFMKGNKPTSKTIDERVNEVVSGMGTKSKNWMQRAGACIVSESIMSSLLVDPNDRSTLRDIYQRMNDRFDEVSKSERGPRGTISTAVNEAFIHSSI